MIIIDIQIIIVNIIHIIIINITLRTLPADLGFCNLFSDLHNEKQYMYCLHMTSGYRGNQQGEPRSI